MKLYVIIDFPITTCATTMQAPRILLSLEEITIIWRMTAPGCVCTNWIK